MEMEVASGNLVLVLAALSGAALSPRSGHLENKEAGLGEF